MMSSPNGVSITRNRGVRSFPAHLLCLEHVTELNECGRSVGAAAVESKQCHPLELRGRPLLLARSPSLALHRTSLLRACDAGSRGSTLRRGPDALGPPGEHRGLVFGDGLLRLLRLLRCAGINV